MPRSYSDYIKTGQMDQLEAIKHNTVRNQNRVAVAGVLNSHARDGLPADAGAFGMLDTIAVKLVEWYGPEGAGEVLRHYATVCERQGAYRDAAHKDSELYLLRSAARELLFAAGPINADRVIETWATGSLHLAYRDARAAKTKGGW